MATEAVGVDITLVAGADLSAKQYYFVKVNSSGQAVLAGAGEAAIGVLQNKPESGRAATVRVGGVTKVVGSASLTVGALIASDASGKAKAAVLGKTDTSDSGAAADALIGSHVVGVLLTNPGADTQIGSLLITHLGAAPTTAA